MRRVTNVACRRCPTGTGGQVPLVVTAQANRAAGAQRSSSRHGTRTGTLGAPQGGGNSSPGGNRVRSTGSVRETEGYRTESANPACSRDAGLGTMPMTKAVNGISRSNGGTAGRPGNRRRALPAGSPDCGDAERVLPTLPGSNRHPRGQQWRALPCRRAGSPSSGRTDGPNPRARESSKGPRSGRPVVTWRGD